jgi:hypothetical protein
VKEAAGELVDFLNKTDSPLKGLMEIMAQGGVFWAGPTQTNKQPCNSKTVKLSKTTVGDTRYYRHTNRLTDKDIVAGHVASKVAISIFAHKPLPRDKFIKAMVVRSNAGAQEEGEDVGAPRSEASGLLGAK